MAIETQEQVKVIMKDVKKLNDGLFTHEEIRGRYDLSEEEEFAVACCSKGLTNRQIMERVNKVKPGMEAVEIRKVMHGRI